MPACVVYALHGFLGQASDWNSIRESLPQVNFIADDLFAKKEMIGTESVKTFPGKKIFLGYSLGGRLGLQILKKDPALFDHYIFLSTNPGLSEVDVQSRKNRLLSDLEWAEKIKEANWSEFLKEWNAQSVFSGSKNEPVRDLKFYDLQKLKTALVNWTLAKQEDFSEVIRPYNAKISWVVGRNDKKYLEIAENMKSKKIISDFKAVEAGHRLWLDRPDAVADLIKGLV